MKIHICIVRSKLSAKNEDTRLHFFEVSYLQQMKIHICIVRSKLSSTNERNLQNPHCAASNPTPKLSEKVHIWKAINISQHVDAAEHHREGQERTNATLAQQGSC
jgi:hypothetical protein